MSSAVSLPNHTFTGQALSSKRLTSIVHILSPETDNCPSWISGRERMTVENISWSISTKECCRLRRGSNPRPPGLQSNADPTEPPRPAFVMCRMLYKLRERIHILAGTWCLFNVASASKKRYKDFTTSQLRRLDVITFHQRRMNVDATSWCCIGVDATLFQRCMPSGLIVFRLCYRGKNFCDFAFVDSKTILKMGRLLKDIQVLKL